MTACYIDSAFPAMLYMAYKYGDDSIELEGASVETALLASANAGGENVARGSLLGALFGRASGLKRIPAHLKVL